MLLFRKVLVMILEIYVFFRRCVFNEFLAMFLGKNMCTSGARANNSGNPCAEVIIFVFFVFSIVWNLKKNEKIMKFRSPFNVTHTGIFLK